MILYTEKCGYSMYGSLFLFDMLLILANMSHAHKVSWWRSMPRTRLSNQNLKKKPLQSQNGFFSWLWPQKIARKLHPGPLQEDQRFRVKNRLSTNHCGLHNLCISTGYTYSDATQESANNWSHLKT